MLSANEIVPIDGDGPPSRTLGEVIEGLQSFNKYVDYAYSKPKEVIDKIADYVNYIISVAPLCCACCLCSTLTSFVAVTSIAIGVGLGVGVGCNQIQRIAINSTSG